MTETRTQAVLSAGQEGVECHTPHAVRSGETTWAAWQGYRHDEEQIYARAIQGETLSPIESLTPDGGRNHSPCMGLVRDVPTCVWISRDSEGTYAVVSSQRTLAGWDAPRALGSDGFAVSLHSDSADGSMAVVWCEAAAPGTYVIRLTVNAGGGWSAPIDVADGSGWVQRPEVAVSATGCWVAWDEYAGGTFGIHAAFVNHDGAVEAREVVSDRAAQTSMVTAEAWQLVPSLALDASREPWIAWLCRQEVVSDTNVLDQWPVARVARRSEGQWQLVHDADGSPDLGVLAWGMLEWQGMGVWGYLGRRRKPLLTADPEGGVRLLWERKDRCNGNTRTAEGVLCARSISAGGAHGAPRVEPTQVVATGPRYYTPVTDAGPPRRELWFTGRVAPEVSVEDVCLVAYDADSAPPFRDEGGWHGWGPVAVDEPQLDPRPEVTIRGEMRPGRISSVEEVRLNLYWADLHVHSTHSADAEGYVDELIAYARDKAHLDCVAFSNNDKHLLSMTSSEYDLDYHFARHFRQLGDLVLLPAYEWSQMNLDSGPRRTNHRTVIAGDRDLPVLRYTEAGSDPLAALAAHAEEYGAILHPHHERWEYLSDSRTETNMEVCSGWGVHMLDPVYREKIHAVLNDGRKLGFIGCSDGHRRTAGTGGGLTGIYAESLSRRAILEALRQHRCFATDGSRIAVQLWAAGEFMGGTAASQGPPEVRWHVQLTQAPAVVTLVRDGDAIASWDAAESQAQGTFIDDDAAPGAHFYYLCVEQSMGWRNHISNVSPAWGPRAWSSPVWVEIAP